MRLKLIVMNLSPFISIVPGQDSLSLNTIHNFVCKKSKYWIKSWKHLELDSKELDSKVFGEVQKPNFDMRSSPIHYSRRFSTMYIKEYSGVAKRVRMALRHCFKPFLGNMPSSPSLLSMPAEQNPPDSSDWPLASVSCTLGTVRYRKTD